MKKEQHNTRQSTNYQSPYKKLIMEVLKKGFFKSKIIIASLVGLVVAGLQATIGVMLQSGGVELIADNLLDAFNQNTLIAFIGAATSIVYIWRRDSMKDPDFEKKPFWQSSILITALVSFIFKVIFYQTGIELPEGLEQETVALLVGLATTGDILAFLSGGIDIAVAIWRTFNTTKVLERKNIFKLKPRLTIGLEEAA